MHGFKSIPYRPLASEDEEGSIGASSEKEEVVLMSKYDMILWYLRRPHKCVQHVYWYFVSGQTILVLCSMLFGAVILAVTTHLLSRPSLQHCLESTTGYSPALEAVELFDEDFQNGFAAKGKYRGPPTVERERDWTALWLQAEVLMPANKIVELNRTGTMLESYMKAPAAEGDGYVAGLEVFHQLHCLNYVRQFTWYLMDSYTDETMPPEFKHVSLKAIRIHADHCIEAVRLALTCHADVTPVLVAMDNHYDPPRPQAEFNAHHRCRNFEKIVAWNKEHALSTFNDKPIHKHDHASR